MATHVSIPLDLELEREKSLEFIDGQFVERVLGGKTHSECQFNIVLRLKPIAKRMGATVHQEWTLARGDEWLIPDVMLTQPGAYETDQRGYLLSIPLLCVEVLSPGQTQSELLRKCRQYHAWGVPHCWVIDPAARVCFESHGSNLFKLVAVGEELRAGDLTLAAADISTDVFAE
jgi:Uma2 family endonuclease